MRGVRKTLLGFGAFALVSILVTAIIWNTLARNVSGPTDRYTATFSDVLGLRVNDDVRIAGVRVGKVTGIGLARDEATRKHVARVSFEVQRNQTLYTDTKALVRYQNLIGQRYVALAPGTDPGSTELRPGGAIPLARTEPSFDISGLLNGFQPLFENLLPEQVNDLSNTLIMALQGDGVSLSAFITQAAAVAADFHRRDAILADVITNLSAIMQGLAKRGDELETLITQTRALVGGLYAQGQSLLSSTEQIATTADTLVRTIDQVQPKLAPAQTSVRDALTLLLDNGAKLDQAAVDLPSILSDIGRFTQNGAYADAYICRLDISLYGILFPRGLWSQIGGPSQSAVCRP
ncbi:MCE family protein [Nocardia mexicana]|uniref:Phospholipid/cholesterol/gamma-HCH transport system substrate-binding protein n=1 Tax=Nocardia mexicana TaxID=279262 RepID=A0A370H1H8_9NOCA|nr:MCE family protein [Nocardia mexicana]RDI49373.1 phospholipid/cholesterol/gamma-HCH transport system substrate-binding protein [Nocardia mexicana]